MVGRGRGRRRAGWQLPSRLSFSRLLTLLKIREQMSDTEQEMPLRLALIKTLRESYKAGVLNAVKSPKYPHNSSLLDRVSLWLVAPICRCVQIGT